MSRLPSISSLMSPPEPKPFESFGQSTVQTQNPHLPSPRNEVLKIKDAWEQDAKDNRRQAPLSPPESPWRKHDKNLVEGSVTSDSPTSKAPRRDPILYPGGSEATVKGLLFEEISGDDARSQVVDEHMRSSYIVPKSKGTLTKRYEMPTKKEYLMMVEFVSNIQRPFSRNPAAYLKRARQEYEEAGLPSKRTRWALGPNQPTHRPGHKVDTPLQHVAPHRKQHSRPHESRLRATPEEAVAPRSKRDVTTPRRVHPSRKQEPADCDFDAIPNYCPPLSTLPDNDKALQVFWPGNPLDLSQDPHRQLLHPAELRLASLLRLTCASYLCVKRRIFVGRVNNFVKGKKFSKTDAQGCGHIDVNKSSKLWTAYEKAGWFDRRHFDDAVKHVSRSSFCYDPALQCMVETAKFFD